MQSQKQRIQQQRTQFQQTSRRFYTHINQKYSNNDKQYPINLEKARLGRRRRVPTKNINLQNLIQKHKINNHVNNFIKKLRLNSVFREVREQDQNYQDKSSLSHSKPIQIGKKFFQLSNFCLGTLKRSDGLSLGNFGFIMWSLVNILQICIMVLIFSFLITFPQVKSYPLILYLRVFSIGLYSIDIILNFSVKRYQCGKYIQKIDQIASYYVKNGFLIDFLSILIFPFDVMFDLKQSVQIFMFVLAIIKLVNNIHKLQRFQYLFINTAKKQQYYGLVKIFIANFVIGHFLSIILNIMGSLNYHQNWLLKFGISESEWYVKYVWGYYWGTTIMLTIGFGDISATNFDQAVALIFIQIFSCITLAYNISYVGSLISSIGQKEKQKKKKLKIFHKMCKDGFVSNTIEQKVSSYIEQQHKIQQSYQFQAHDEILKSLPCNLQRQYRKEANRTLFQNLGLFSHLSKRSLLQLGQLISRKICHPQQIVVKRGTIQSFMIIQSGQLGLLCSNRSRLDGFQVQTIEVNPGQKPKILSYDFIKNKISNYNVKSIGHSVLFYLDRQQLMKSLKQSQMSYQIFCMLKDKDEQMLGQNNAHLCPVCKNQYHNKFQCSRLHYVPLKSVIILKKLAKANKTKQKGQPKFCRMKTTKFKLCSIELLKNAQKQYIQDNYDDNDYRQMQNIQKFYSKFAQQLENQTYNINVSNQNMKSTYLGSIPGSQSLGFGLNMQNFGQLQRRISNYSSIGRKSVLPNLNINQMIKKSSQKQGIGNKTLYKIKQILDDRQNEDFWDCQIDVAENYAHYFRDYNSNSLGRGKKNRKNKQKTFNIYR